MTSVAATTMLTWLVWSSSPSLQSSLSSRHCAAAAAAAFSSSHTASSNTRKFRSRHQDARGGRTTPLWVAAANPPILAPVTRCSLVTAATRRFLSLSRDSKNGNDWTTRRNNFRPRLFAASSDWDDFDPTSLSLASPTSQRQPPQRSPPRQRTPPVSSSASSFASSNANDSSPSRRIRTRNSGNKQSQQDSTDATADTWYDDENGSDGRAIKETRFQDYSATRNEYPSRRNFRRPEYNTARSGAAQRSNNYDARRRRPQPRLLLDQPPAQWNGRRSTEPTTGDKVSLRTALLDWDHLYGLACVENALMANVRDFARVNDDNNNNDGGGAVSPQPTLAYTDSTPMLLVQTETTLSQRSRDKQAQAVHIQSLARDRGVPILAVDKGILNTLSSNRPHQGHVLRCGPLWKDNNDYFLTQLSIQPTDITYKPFWLVLDEVMDPQNLGALLRSVYFLSDTVGVLLCAKNSAPLSPTVSAASAGALERLIHRDNDGRENRLYRTSNLPRLLSLANAQGCRIVGASSSVPKYMDVPLYNLQHLPRLEVSASGETPPTLLVLGSEGHGLRTLVAQACTELVRIPGGSGTKDGPTDKDADDDTGGGVDSLNVSVTGGILLWHFLQPTSSRSE
jgi:21S rRNA (GM2251-2'-O)-methyltransferase